MSWLQGLGSNIFGGAAGATPPAPPNAGPSGAAAQGKALLSNPGAWTSATNAVAGGSSMSDYKVDEMVQYNSSEKGWIDAKVVKVIDNNTLVLDCKPKAVSLDRVRKRPAVSFAPVPTGAAAMGGSQGSAASTGATFKEGEMVEYFSASKGIWIAAKVVQSNGNGTFNLDCKQNVPGDKMRPGTGHGSALAGLLPTALSSMFGGAGKSQAAAAFNVPVQLLRVTKAGSGWRYEVNAEGAKALEAYGTRRIAVASICGPSRAGKSLLLNLMLERVQKGLPLFKVGAAAGTAGKPCTDGLWIWGSADESDTKGPLTAFMDCAGIGGDGNATRDAQLFVLCAVLSSVVVMNTTGKLDDAAFKSLAETCSLIPKFIEQDGNDATKPLLLWTLRDFPLEEIKQSNPDQYLEKALQSGSGSAVNKTLSTLFPRKGCMMLVQPTNDEKQMSSLVSMPYARLRPEFRTSLEALGTQLKSACRNNPKSIAGHSLSCSAFVTLLRKLTELLNSGNVPLHVRSAWADVQTKACGAAHSEVTSSARDRFAPLAERGEGPGVTMSMKVRNVDHAALHHPTNRKTLAIFTDTVKKTIAQHAHPQGMIKAQHVTVQLDQGSVVVNARIAPPHDANPAHVHSALTSAKAEMLPKAIAASLGSSMPSTMLNFASIVTGPLRVDSVTDPVQQNVPMLPMADAPLHALVMKHKTELQAHWDNNSVGDERTKKDFAASLEDEINTWETRLKSKNEIAARAVLDKAVKSWEDWVNSEETWQEGEKALLDFDAVMERIPSSVLWRGGLKSAFDSTARLLAKVRNAHQKASQAQSLSATQVALLGDHAVTHEAELERMKERYYSATDETERTAMTIRVLEDELRDHKLQLRNVLGDVERANDREQQIGPQFQRFEEVEERLQNELAATRMALAKLEADHANLRAIHESVCGDRMRLEVDMDHFRGTAERAIADRMRLEGEGDETHAHCEQLKSDLQKANERFLHYKQQLLEGHRSLEEATRVHGLQLDEARTAHRNDLNEVSTKRDMDKNDSESRHRHELVSVHTAHSREIMSGSRDWGESRAAYGNQLSEYITRHEAELRESHRNLWGHAEAIAERRVAPMLNYRSVTYREMCKDLIGKFSEAELKGRWKSLQPAEVERRLDPALGGRAVTYAEMMYIDRTDRMSTEELNRHWQTLKPAEGDRRNDPELNGRAVTLNEMQAQLRNSFSEEELRRHWNNLKPAEAERRIDPMQKGRQITYAELRQGAMASTTSAEELHRHWLSVQPVQAERRKNPKQNGRAITWDELKSSGPSALMTEFELTRYWQDLEVDIEGLSSFGSGAPAGSPMGSRSQLEEDKLQHEHKQALLELGSLKAKHATAEEEINKSRVLLEQAAQQRQQFLEEQQKLEAVHRLSQEATHASYKWKETELLQSEGKSRAFADKLESAQQSFEEELAAKRDQQAKLAADHDAQIQAERGQRQSVNDNVHQDLQRMDQASMKRFDEFEKEHREAREVDKKRLLEREKDAAQLQGEAQVLKEQKERLLAQVKDLQDKLKDSEARCGSSQGVQDRIEQLRTELEKTRGEHSEKLRTQAELYERRLADLGDRPKKGCFRF